MIFVEGILAAQLGACSLSVLALKDALETRFIIISTSAFTSYDAHQDLSSEGVSP